MGTTERGPRRSVTCAAVSEAVLTLLKWCVLVLLYLFFFRVMQVTWASLRAPARRVATPTGPVPATTATAASRPTKVANDHAWALEVVEGDTINGSVHQVQDELTIGRSAGCHLTLDDTYVSQFHVRVTIGSDHRPVVEDLGSTNGTYLNRQRVSAPVIAGVGDRLQVGSTVFVVR